MEDATLHVAIKAPFNSGTPYHKYKGFFSIVIMAICDVNCCFNYIDVRNYVSNSNTVLLNSDIGQIPKSNSRGHSKMTLPKNQLILTPPPPPPPLPLFVAKISNPLPPLSAAKK